MHDLIPSIKEIKEFWKGVKFGLQAEHIFSGQYQTHFAFRVEQIAELAGTHRANFNAGRVASDTVALDAPGALFNDTPHARPVHKVMRLRVHLFLGKDRCGEVDTARPVRAGAHAHAAADAPVVVDHHHPVWLTVSCSHRTNLDTRGFLTMHAGYRHVV